MFSKVDIVNAYEKSRPFWPTQLCIILRLATSIVNFTPRPRGKIERMSKSVKRLFDGFQPAHYQLELTLDSHAMTFEGQVTIEGLKVGRPSQRLTFHQKELVINRAEIVRHDKKGDQIFAVNRINNHKRLNEVRLHTASSLFPGKYTVTLAFRGKITRVMQGIYPCYFDYRGKQKVLLATQFEAPHAREAFPCIDEPEAKATFQLSLVVPKNQVVLSNTPLASQESLQSNTQKVAGKKLDSGLIRTTFETTPRMSTYLLAFVVGDLHYHETKTKAGVVVRSWAAVSRSKIHLKYASLEAARILDFFADYFDIPYPLVKLDQVALPDFDAGAMENWGLVTYRETALLTDPINRSISNEQFVTMVVAHELSHQWFGNLVTMKWWDDLWLNESFAGLMEHLAPAALHPDWQQWELYAAGDISLITSRDVYKDIQPVGVDVTDPDLIESLFDPAIVYAKGARLIKMLREYIGDHNFSHGLRTYFTAHAYNNATRHDLWQALSHTSHKHIESFMVPWLIKPGMPVVHVTQKGKILKLKQERFLLDGKPDDSLWPIPLLADAGIKHDMFEEPHATIKLASDRYVLLNQHGSGQYITHYTEPAHRAHLAQLMQTGKMPTEARINLLNDMYMLARHGDASLVDSLEIIKQCGREPRDSVWALLARAIGAATQLTEGNKQTEKQLHRFRINLSQHWYDELGWQDREKDDANTKQLRHTIVALMIASEYQPAIDEALKRYKRAKNLEQIDAELRNTILGAAVRHGDKNVVPYLLKAYEAASPDIQADITGGLASTRQPATAEHILTQAIGPKGFVRDQDVLRWIAMMLRNHHIRTVVWDFMTQNWDWLEKTLGQSKSFDYLPTYAASIVTTEEWAKKYKQFFKPKEQVKTLKHNIRLGYADIDARVAWRQREETRLKTFFKPQP